MNTLLPVKILAVHTADPPLQMTQQESLEYILGHFPGQAATLRLYERVFRNTGIETRAFALNTPGEVLITDPDRIGERFRERAVALSVQALTAVLAATGTPPGRPDFLGTATCTGYLCPGLSSYLLESCGLRPDIRAMDAAGMGCGAALPLLEQASHFLSAHPESLAATVNTEICTAAMVADDAPDLVVSNAIFADGSAACLLARTANAGGAELLRFETLTQPEHRESLRFRLDKGRLRNVLAKEVPDLAGRALQTLCERLLRGAGRRRAEVDFWILHAGGAKVLDALQKSLGLGEDALRWSRQTLRRQGNLSSPTVLYTLREVLHSSPPPGTLGIMASFGAGFSAHAALLRF